MGCVAGRGGGGRFRTLMSVLNISSKFILGCGGRSLRAENRSTGRVTLFVWHIYAAKRDGIYISTTQVVFSDRQNSDIMTGILRSVRVTAWVDGTRREV